MKQCFATIYVVISVFLQGAPLLFMTGCLPYRTDSITFLEECRQEPLSEEEVSLAQHWLYSVIPRHRHLIRWYDLPHWVSWALLGNDDDGIFGEAPAADYCCDIPPPRRALQWGLRNPFHNFTFYCVGTAGCRNSQLTLFSITPCRIRVLHYQPIADTVFADESSSVYLALHGWKPFFSLRLRYPYCRQSKFYIGWRERGNLGLKLQPLASTP